MVPHRLRSRLGFPEPTSWRLVKLAGLGWRVFGLIVLLAGAAILSIGIWNHVYGPPLDKGTVNDDRFPVPSELNIVVYVVAGLCLLGGLILIMLRRVKE